MSLLTRITMSETDPREIKLFSNIFLFLIILTTFMIFLFAIMATLENNDKSCQSQRYQEYKNVADIDSAYILYNPNHYFLQEFSLEDNNINNYLFCYTINVSGDRDHKVTVIDQDLNSLGTEYVFRNKTKEYCTQIDKSFIQDPMRIGLMCETCALGYTITPMQAIIGETASQVYYNNTHYSVNKDTTLLTRVVGEQACRNLSMQFFWWYLWIVFACGLILALLFGIDKFRGFLLETTK